MMSNDNDVDVKERVSYKCSNGCIDAYFYIYTVEKGDVVNEKLVSDGIQRCIYCHAMAVPEKKTITTTTTTTTTTVTTVVE